MPARRIIWITLLLAACASYGGRGLKPGIDGLADVLQLMGEPALQWHNPDGSTQLAYPRGPAGHHTFMVSIGADGKLQRIENVLDNPHFSRIQPGMGKDEVLRILGPSWPGWTAYFARRDELVWEWRFCDDWNESARFDVLFDNTSGKVRKTISMPEALRGLCGKGVCPC